MSESPSSEKWKDLAGEPLADFLAEHELAEISEEYDRYSPRNIFEGDDEDNSWHQRTLYFFERGLDLPPLDGLAWDDVDREADEVLASLRVWRHGPTGSMGFNPAARLAALQHEPEGNQNLLLVGPSGSGKTTVAMEKLAINAMGIQTSMCCRSLAVLTAREFCNEVSARAKSSSIAPWIGLLKDRSCVIFDDASAAKYTERCTEEFLDLLSARIERRHCTIVTMHSNLKGLARQLEAKDFHSGKVVNADIVNAVIRRFRTEFRVIDFSNPNRPEPQTERRQ